MDFSLPGGKRLKIQVSVYQEDFNKLKCKFLTSLQPTLLNIWRARVASKSFTLLLWNILDIGLLHQKASITNRSTFVCSKLFTNIRHTVEVSILHSLCGPEEESHQKYVFSLPLWNILTHQSVITTKHGRQGFVLDCVYRKHFN